MHAYEWTAQFPVSELIDAAHQRIKELEGMTWASPYHSLEDQPMEKARRIADYTAYIEILTRCGYATMPVDLSTYNLFFHPIREVAPHHWDQDALEEEINALDEQLDDLDEQLNKLERALTALKVKLNHQVLVTT